MRGEVAECHVPFIFCSAFQCLNAGRRNGARLRGEAAMTIGPDFPGAVTAFNRFGLGARPGDLNAAAGDPRGFLQEELRVANVALIHDTVLPSGPEALTAYDHEVARQAGAAAMTPAAQSKAPTAATPPATGSSARLAAAPPTEPSVATMADETSATGPTEQIQAKLQSGQPDISKLPVQQALYWGEAAARLQKQLQARSGFVERLVAFWSNHFAVSVAKSPKLLVSAGPFEREAIRPNALGKFSALLRAAESHPAMILFLDNQFSMGPDTTPGRSAGHGLNENLAREILELHTLGAGSGYTQTDVTELARILTGWSVVRPDSPAGTPGAFVFRPIWHEPGARMLLDKTYAEGGVEQGRAALDDLARHPATSRHIATKLVRHFVADDPPADLVDALALKFRDSDGDLSVVASALVADDRAWRAKPTKMRNALEFVMGASRATGFAPPGPGLYLEALNLLGMPLWQPPGPNGFSDSSGAWSSPEGMKIRLDLAWFMGQRMHDATEPLATLRTVLGDTASEETRQAIQRAESREQALALLFMSPEFQRR
jgi:uncharacterized protein (DUF1800 family)